MKEHFVNHALKPEDYIRSPHVYNSLLEGNFSSCGKVALSHTHADIRQVTCVACKRIWRGENPNYDPQRYTHVSNSASKI